MTLRRLRDRNPNRPASWERPEKLPVGGVGTTCRGREVQRAPSTRGTFRAVPLARGSRVIPGGGKGRSYASAIRPILGYAPTLGIGYAPTLGICCRLPKLQSPRGLIGRREGTLQVIA